MVRKTLKNIGAILLEQGVISQYQWEMARSEETAGKESLQKTLVRMGFVSEEEMVRTIVSETGIAHIELNNLSIDPKIIALIPDELAHKYRFVPVFKMGNTITCAMSDVFNAFAVDEIALKTGLSVEPAISTEKEIRKALAVYYAGSGDADGSGTMSEASKMSSASGAGDTELAQDAPVVKYVNGLITRAVSLSASDVHIEPDEKNINVRFRIDGVLYPQPTAPKEFQQAMSSRIKIMAGLNIAESRRPQDGRFQLQVEGKQIDIRVSCLPTIHGENIVLRVLITNTVLLGLEEIGFDAKNLEIFRELLNRPNGIILVTGPTGSGKTTTLYSSISMINNTGKAIYTIEDPVEYHLPGIRQTQVEPGIGLTFAAGLRSILRQDPNIIMVGEIRDAETAQIAIQAALTGHLVFATLHTNSAAGAISRLIDIGIEPFLLSSSIIGVMGQRLVRLVCRECRGQGCLQCFQSGYKGRTGIYELMVPDQTIRDLIMQRRSTSEIHDAAKSKGMRSMLDGGLEKVALGLTTKEEVFRVTQ